MRLLLCRVLRKMPKHTAFCGTWSLLGTELDAPDLDGGQPPAGCPMNSVQTGKSNYLKIIGLWLIQESRREYKRRGQAYSFASWSNRHFAAEPLRSFIDPDAPEFVAPATRPAEYRNFAAKPASPSRKRWKS